MNIPIQLWHDGYSVIVAAFLVISISCGLLFFRRRSIAEFLIFTGFFCLFMVQFLNTFWGYRAAFDAQMNLIEETPALLSMNMSYLISSVGSVSAAIGFVIKVMRPGDKT